MAYTIAKYDWLAAEKCPTMAWHELRVHKPAPDEGTIFRMQQGQEVGALARGLYPNGVFVARREGAAPVEVTQTLVADASSATLFEAAFGVGPFVAKADILTREGDGWHVLEVKSSFSDTTNIKEHVDDLAYTVMVLRRAGLTVTRASLVLLSRDYRFGGNAEQLFEIIDKTDDVATRVGKFEGSIDARAVSLLDDNACPTPIMVSACRSCRFFSDRCLGAGLAHTVLELPSLHHTKLRTLSEAGVIALSDVPAEFVLTDRQQRVKDAALSGQVFIGPGLREVLHSIRWPCHYLDFETMATVMPLYDGHACHRQVLTQFSVHHRDGPDAVPHQSEFLADARQNEERRLASTLIDVLGRDGSIIVYGTFEKTRINALREAFPDLADALGVLLGRLVDLNAIVTNHVYHPEFRGRLSIKAVLPALVPGLSYEGLAVADGDTAMAKFAGMARGEITGDDVAATRYQLLEYCRMDTLGMVRLHETLSSLAA